VDDNFRSYEDPKRNRDFFVYEAQTVALGTGANAVDQIQIQADADFILQKLAYQADIAGATQTISSRVVPNVLVQLTDTGSNRQLFQQPVPIPSIFGTGELPFILPNPRLFMKTSVIQIDFTSFEAAVTPTIRLAFIGYKFYRLS
jgi:hypothetical protein